MHMHTNIFMDINVCVYVNVCVCMRKYAYVSACENTLLYLPCAVKIPFCTAFIIGSQILVTQLSHSYHAE